MRNALSVVDHLTLGADGVYSGMVVDNKSQILEMELRESVAKKEYDNYLEPVALSHSIPVMDAEIEIF